MLSLDVMAAIVVVAIIYVLVRPQSQGAQMVSALGNAIVAIVRNAADLAGTGGK